MMMETEKKQIIHQWQDYYPLPPELLRDDVLQRCRDLGITSLQSYLTWSNIEKEAGKLDFSDYDPLVEKLQQHGLKWVPFLILGPNYATPEWFKDSSENLYARCLEHDLETKIQSIWNPDLPIRVDNFMQAVAEHYRGREIIESIVLGISGSWGEVLYPSPGGFLWRKEKFHIHYGWWCGDDVARRTFREDTLKSYSSLDAINREWGTGYTNADEIDFPDMSKQRSALRELYFKWVIRNISCRGCMRKVLDYLSRTYLYNRLRFQGWEKEVDGSESSPNAKYWSFFVDWYCRSMTNWAEYWLKASRQFFPKEDIYLAVGGDGRPQLGADFSALAKLSAEYRAGLRVTNATDDFLTTFSLNRLTDSACKFYGAYYSTEEAGVSSPRAISMRIFDSVSSNARSVYFKSLVDIFSKNGQLGQLTLAGRFFRENRKYLELKPANNRLVVFAPVEQGRLSGKLLVYFNYWLQSLRKHANFEVADERMIADDYLEGEEDIFLICLAGCFPEEVVKRVNEYNIFIYSPGKKGIGSTDSFTKGAYAESMKELIRTIESRNEGKLGTFRIALADSGILEYSPRKNQIKTISLSGLKG